MAKLSSQIEKSLLWEISGAGLNKPSYFFGTMHLMCAEDAFVSETIISVIKAVEQIYLEIDMEDVSTLYSELVEERRLQKRGLYSSLSADDYYRVKSFFLHNNPNIHFSAIEDQPPLMIASALYRLLLPCEHTNGIEIKIIEEAKRLRKQSKGLESIAFQISIFECIPDELQAKHLLTFIDNIDQQKVLINQMVNAYKDQDIELLYRLGVQDEIIKDYLDLLIVKRNRNWLEQFSLIANEASTLFAVGAGHLAGENGVLQLLLNSGYSIRAIPG